MQFICFIHAFCSPVKLVCEIIGLPTYVATVLFTIGFVFIISANAQDLMYFSVKVIESCRGFILLSCSFVRSFVTYRLRLV